jgi:hypothetical protein
MKELIDQAPEIIKEAAQSPLAMIALMILALAVLAWFFFKNAPYQIKLWVFLLLFVGVAGFTAAAIHEGALTVKSKDETKKMEVALLEKQQARAIALAADRIKAGSGVLAAQSTAGPKSSAVAPSTAAVLIERPAGTATNVGKDSAAYRAIAHTLAALESDSATDAAKTSNPAAGAEARLNLDRIFTDLGKNGANASYARARLEGKSRYEAALLAQLHSASAQLSLKAWGEESVETYLKGKGH